MVNRRLPTVLLAFLVPIAVPAGAQRQSPGELGDEIALLKLTDPVILEHLRTSGTARVIVLLTADQDLVVGNLADEQEKARVKADVARARDTLLRSKSLAALRATEQLQITRQYRFIASFAATVDAAALRELQADPRVEWIEPDLPHTINRADGLALMNVQPAFDAGYSGFGISIAVVDTGIDYTHQELGGGTFPNTKVIGGRDIADDDPDPMDCQGHGTACAGIAAGDPGGVAPGASLYALKIVHGCGDTADSSDIIDAWDWCIQHQNDDPAAPIRIISTSFGNGERYTAVCDGQFPNFAQAVTRCGNAGIALFVSSGNDGYCDGISRPSCIGDVIAVGAVYDANINGHSWCVEDQSCVRYGTGGCESGWACRDSTTTADQVTCYSNSAAILDLFAPSHCANTPTAGGGYENCFGGTSAACPYAAGAAALLQENRIAVCGSPYSPAELREIMARDGDPIADGKANPPVTKPRVNVGNSLIIDCPGLTVQPSALDLGVVARGPIYERYVWVINNSSIESIEWRATPSQTWIEIEPDGGIILPDDETLCTVSVRTSGLNEGQQYNESITFEWPGGSQVVPVTLEVAPSIPECILPDCDTFVDESRPNDNFCSLPVLRVEDDGEQMRRRAYLRFDLSSVPPDMQIVSATLRLHAISWNARWGDTLYVARARDPWGECCEVTWNNQPDTDTRLSPIHIPRDLGSDDWLEVDLTEWTNVWYNNPSANNGLQLRSVRTGYGAGLSVSFNSSEDPPPPEERPHLCVNYIEPPPDFSLVATPSAVVIDPGEDAQAEISASPLGGFSGSIVLELDHSLPQCASASLEDDSIPVPGNTWLTIMTDACAPLGIYPVVVTGTAPGGSPSHQVLVNVQIGTDLGPLLTITDIEVPADPPTGTVTVEYTACDPRDQNLWTRDWQYSLDDAEWHDISPPAVGNNDPKPSCFPSFVTWDTRIDLDCVQDDRVWFRMKATNGTEVGDLVRGPCELPDPLVTNATGMASAGETAFWVSEHTGTERVVYKFEISGCSVTNVGQFSAPDDKVPTGLAFDGTYLYVCNAYPDGKIWKLTQGGDPVNWQTFDFRLYGLAFDGTYLWSLDRNGNVWKHSASSLGVVEGPFPLGDGGLPCSDTSGGLAADGQGRFLYVTHDGSTIRQYRLSDMQLVTTFGGGSCTGGLGHDGMFLWSVDSAGYGDHECAVRQFNLFPGTSEYAEYGSFPIDNNPAPTPNPMMFASEPVADGPGCITMEAVVATLEGCSTIEYYFEEVTEHEGGDDSGWQTLTNYTDCGLAPNTQYAYRVRARGACCPDPAETADSATVQLFSLANPPVAAPFGEVTATTIEVIWESGGNPPGTKYFCEETTGTGLNSGWIDQTQWHVSGLDSQTEYCFHVKARNHDEIETEWVDLGCVTTPPKPGELSVTPVEDFHSSGPPGGPFEPPEKEYSLENVGEEPLDWEALITGDLWEFDDGSAFQTGSLQPGEAVLLTAQLNDEATNQDCGTYAGGLSATNLTNDLGSTTRNLALTVGPPTEVPDPVQASDGTHCDKVRITWNEVVGADSYCVYRSEFNDFAAAEVVNNCASTGESYEDSTAAPGTTYYYWVTAQNTCGEGDPAGPDVGSTGAAPQAAFAAHPTKGPAPLTVRFTNQSDGEYDQCHWDFGDDGSSTDYNPVHTYTECGRYTVTLTVSNNCGSDAETKTDYVFVVCPVVADLSGQPLQGPAPLTVDFADESEGEIDTWYWDFGDGSTADDRNLTHVYQAPGQYTVGLTVSGPDDSDTITKQGYVVVDAPPTGPAPPSESPDDSTGTGADSSFEDDGAEITNDQPDGGVDDEAEQEEQPIPEELIAPECGAGLCGFGTVAMLPWTLLTLGAMKIGAARARCRRARGPRRHQGI